MPHQEVVDEVEDAIQLLDDHALVNPWISLFQQFVELGGESF
jgi:hypothetical protein